MAKAGQAPPEGPQSGESQEAAPAQEARPSVKEYESNTTGKTLVRTRPGHSVTPSDKSLPTVDSIGVRMGAANAKAVVDEFPEYAFIDEEGE